MTYRTQSESFLEEKKGDSLSQSSIPLQNKSKRIWFHAVSVGEMNLLKPVLKEIELLHPTWEIVISTTSKTGMLLGHKLFSQRTVFYCPLDFSWAVRNAMKRIQPDMLCLVELELWPNLIAAAKQNKAKVAIINGRISDKSFRRYFRIRAILPFIFRQIDLIAVQDEMTAQSFRNLGAATETIKTTGSIKFDGVQMNRNNAKTLELSKMVGISDSDIVFLAGSTQDPEELLALQTFRELWPNESRLRLILVPRHPERFDAVAKMLDQSEFSWTRRSCFSSNDLAVKTTEPKATDPKTEDSKPRILLVDTIGELGAFWGRADIAFVGGSLGKRGGQNMLEPAAYGAAVSFGPNTKNFRDISSMMLNAKAAVVVSNQKELTQFVARCLNDWQWKEELGKNAQKLVLKQQGATKVTLQYLENLLE
ncbi:MAG: 3-deoxy-D-manno-octulosonic acid transferase [Planctomycetia bacterium]|nr:3-deoxy-D-manno-octulosonic acid transferase [Planctomycetia bacterium]